TASSVDSDRRRKGQCSISTSCGGRRSRSPQESGSRWPIPITPRSPPKWRPAGSAPASPCRATAAPWWLAMGPRARCTASAPPCRRRPSAESLPDQLRRDRTESSSSEQRQQLALLDLLASRPRQVVLEDDPDGHLVVSKALARPLP